MRTQWQADRNPALGLQREVVAPFRVEQVLRTARSSKWTRWEVANPLNTAPEDGAKRYKAA